MLWLVSVVSFCVVIIVIVVGVRAVVVRVGGGSGWWLVWCWLVVRAVVSACGG